MRALIALTLAVVLGCALSARPAAALTVPAGFEAETIAEGLDFPVAVTWAPDGRAFVAEKSGRVKIVDVDRTTSELLDISGHVNDFGDRGLIGIALDTDFADNGYLYLLYVYDPGAADSDAPTSSRLTRVTVGQGDTVSPETVIVGKDSDGACPAPAPDLDCLPADADTHAIGTVRATSDGTLWLGSGDGFYWENGPFTPIRTGNPDSLAGKILHVDRDGNGLPGHALCPGAPLSDNCAKVFAMGFRNPFRFFVRDDGAVVIGDVGQNSFEELDVARAGGDYGWPCYEGPGRTPGFSDLPDCDPLIAREGAPTGARGPAWSYPHEAGLRGAIVAGPMYDGDAYPAGYRGTWFVGDYVRNWVQRLTFAGDDVTAVTPFIEGSPFVELATDPDGDLVLVDIGTGPGEGALRRILYSPGNAAPVVTASGTPTSGEAPLEVSFSSAGSSDPDGDTLSYSWDFGDGSPASTSPNPTHTYISRGGFDARLRVSDGRGRSTSKIVHITVSGPRATITSPADGSLFTAGETVSLTGDAVDVNGDQLPASALRWDVLLIHDTHAHPGTSASGRNFSFRTADDHDADSYYRVTLTATDSAGATDRRTITVLPRTVELRLASDPPGAPLSYGPESVVAPVSRRAAVGYKTSVGAAAEFERDGRRYEILGWSDGGAQLHSLAIPGDDLELVARYRDLGPVTAAPATDPGAAPGVQPPAGGVPVVDRRPTITVTWPRSRTTVTSLRGTASDPDGVRSVQVALVRAEKKGCRWWSVRRKRLANVPGSCDFPNWMAAKLGTRGAWSVSLGGRVPRDRYTVIVRVRDRAGGIGEAKYRGRWLGR